MKKEAGIRVVGRWVAQPMVPAERLEGQQVFEVCADPTRSLLLEGRELAVYDGRNTHLRLRWRKLMQITPELLAVEFSHWDRPWLAPITFYCQSSGQEVTDPHWNRGATAMAITIGYPSFPAQWVVSVERVA